MSSDSGILGEICAICLEVFNNYCDVFLLGCSHVFHLTCLRGWTEERMTCPYCRELSVPPKQTIVRCCVIAVPELLKRGVYYSYRKHYRVIEVMDVNMFADLPLLNYTFKRMSGLDLPCHMKKRKYYKLKDIALNLHILNWSEYVEIILLENTLKSYIFRKRERHMHCFIKRDLLKVCDPTMSFVKCAHAVDWYESDAYRTYILSNFYKFCTLLH